jgi:hypothetical protein
MTTAEYITTGNVYRAIGGECWMAHVGHDHDGSGTIWLKPEAWKVRVAGIGSIPGSIEAVTVTGGRKCNVQADHLHDEKADALRDASLAAAELDGTTAMGALTYRLKAEPKRKAEPVQYRVFTTATADGPEYSVQFKDATTRRWKPVLGLWHLTKWKAGDCVKRLTHGDDIPGFWRLGQTMEFIELVDNVE